MSATPQQELCRFFNGACSCAGDLVHRKTPAELRQARQSESIPGTLAVLCNNPNAVRAVDDADSVTCQECREWQGA